MKSLLLIVCIITLIYLDIDIDVIDIVTYSIQFIMANKNSFVFYDGPSQLNGKPIVGIVTVKSTNEKIGNMLQTWILNRDQHPVESTRNGEDSSICGNCWRKPSNSGTCYVNLAFAPSGVWRSYDAGDIDSVYLLKHRNYYLRLGSYGDPMAIPIEVWERLLFFCKDHVGYTSQWRNRMQLPEDTVNWYKNRIMASCASHYEAQTAIALGWKPYIALPQGATPPDYAIQCLSTDGITCDHCLKCNAQSEPVWIYDHGAPWKIRHV